jgi:hypothetical protein
VQDNQSLIAQAPDSGSKYAEQIVDFLLSIVIRIAHPQDLIKTQEHGP